MRKPFIVVGLAILILAGLATGIHSSYNECSAPAFVAAGVPPLVMLVLSKDHTAFFEAYNDTFDVDNDGVIDNTYKDSIDYYGYFDSAKCYEYNTTDKRFNPIGTTTQGTHYCDSSDTSWSGNFLNWATMTRMDALRKVLYGGFRGSKRADSGDTDTASLTVLERVYLPTDGHTWVKVYSGSDLYRLTQYTASEVSAFPDQSISIFNVTATTEMTSCPSGLVDLPVMRVAKGKYHDWDVTEVKQGYYSNENSTSSALKPGSSQRLTDLAVRVKACVAPLSDTERDQCKEYTPNSNNFKPIGLLQRYSNSIHFGLLSGSYGQNAAGGILRKPIQSIDNEINTDGTFKNNDGIIKTVNNVYLRGYSVSDGKYSGTTYGEVLKPGMPGQNNWGNPIGEMLYESLRYFAGKKTPTATYATTKTSDCPANPTAYDITLGLPGPTWDDPYGTHPYCAQPYMLVLTDIYPSYDSDHLPDSAFNTFTGDLADLDVATLTNTIGSNENLPTSTYIGEVYPTPPDNICSAKSPFSMGNLRGLCPGYSGVQGSYYSAGVSYYGRKTDLRSSVSGDQKPATFVVALSNPLPTITLTTASNKKVTISPVSKATGGSTPTNCSYVKSRVLNQNGDNGTLEIAWEDSYFANDFDKDWIQMLRWKVSGETVTVETYLRDKAAGNRMDAGYVISGTTNDGLKMDLKATIQNYAYTNIGNYSCTTNPSPDPDGDANACFGGYSNDNNNPSTAPDCYTLSCSQVVYSKRSYTSGTSGAAQYLQSPLWYAAKWGGFTDLNKDGVPGPSNMEWDKDGNGVPDSYFLVTNPSKLYEQMNQAFIAILARSGAAGAVATVTQQVQGQDMLVRGAFTSYENDPKTFVWKGHLESYWPYEGCKDYTTQTDCRKYSGCTWVNSTAVCSGWIYSFQKPEYQDKFCYQHHQYCWEAEERLPAPSNRTIFTLKKGQKKSFDSGNICDGNDTLALTGDSQYHSDNCTDMVGWIRGMDGWTLARDRDGWTLGDIVYSTPVVVQEPSLSAIPAEGSGSCGAPCSSTGCDCSDTSTTSCRAQCFFCYRECEKARDRMIYVGANDGMLHAFIGGVWDSANQTWITDPASDTRIGKERWAYIPSNLLSKLKELARVSYGTEGGCVHRFMVDLSPQAYEVYIDPTGTGTSREWRTVLIGGERGGGDALFALDVTDPDDPRILWEYPIFRNMVQITEDNSTYRVSTPYRARTDYETVKALPSSWAIPSVGKLKLPNGVSFLSALPISPQDADDNITPTTRGGSDLSGWVAVVPTAPRIFQPSDLDDNRTQPLTQPQKEATFKPNLLMIDIENGVNIFQYVWPLLLATQPSHWPTVTNGTNTIPYAPGSPVVLDLWNGHGSYGMDGYLDHIYFGDLNGNFYGLRFNLDDNSSRGMEVDFWKTKNIPASDNATNTLRSGYEPISTMPAAALDPHYNLHLYFGTGKYDTTGTYSDKTDNATMSFYSVEDNGTRPTIDATADVSGTGPISVSNGLAAFRWNGFGVDVNPSPCSPLPTFDDNCTWVKSNGSADCCEYYNQDCANPCWNCIYDLNSAGERVVDSPLVAGGLVFFTTFLPNTDPCLAGGYAYLYVMDYLCRDLPMDPLSGSGLTKKANLDFPNLQTGEYAKMESGGKTAGYVAKIGVGMPSRPVLDSSANYLFIQTSVAQILRIPVELAERPLYLKGWKEEE